MATCDSPTDVAPRTESGDALYGPRASVEAFIEWVRGHYPFSAVDWNTGWGWDTPTDFRYAFGRTLNAIWCLEYSSPTPSEDIDPDRRILDWAGRFARENFGGLQARCGDDWLNGDGTCAHFQGTDARTGPPVFGDWTDLYMPFFYCSEVPKRAGILIHEARHASGVGHDDNGFDSSWEYNGAWRWNVCWLAWYANACQNTNAPLKQLAVDRANVILGRDFTTDPGFRLDSTGSIAIVKWRPGDLTKLSKVPTGPNKPFPAGDPHGFAFEAHYDAIVVYRASDNHIHELFWDPKGWHFGDLMTQPKTQPMTSVTPLAASDPHGFVFKAHDQAHVVYRAADATPNTSHIHDLYWNASGWHDINLTQQSHAPTGPQTPQPVGNPHGFALEAQGNLFIPYRTSDNHIHLLIWDPSGWRHNDVNDLLPKAVPRAASDPHGFAFEGHNSAHIIYRTSDGHIHHVFWNASGWHDGPLTQATTGPKAPVGDPYGFALEAQGNLFIAYRTKDNHISLLIWDPSGWRSPIDVDQLLNKMLLLAASDPSGFAFEKHNSANVIYRASDGHIHQVFWDPSGWHDGNLTQLSGVATGPGQPVALGVPHSFAFQALNDAIVVYRASDNHIDQLYWG